MITRAGFFVVLAIAVGASRSTAQVAFMTANGDSPGDRLGFSSAGVGDLDGNGVGEVIAGAPQDDNNGVDSGSARVLSGLGGSILLAFDGDSAGDRFGQSVAGIGDFDLDGVVDVAVGAPFDDNTGVDSGSARVFSGATAATLFTFNGTAAGDRFGIALAGAGDVNQDGRADVLIGTQTTNPVQGYVRVVAGGTGATLAQIASATVGFGRAVSGGADWNGDGVPDFAIGATNSIEVRSGAGAAILFSAAGDSVGDDFGRALAFASDFTGDGLADLVVGAPLDDNTATDSGSVRAFDSLGATILYTVNGDSAGDQLGFDVGTVADLYQDGLTDFVAGVPFRDSGAGVDAGGFRVYSGFDGNVIYTVDGLAAGDHLGFSARSAGLVNSDIYGDIVAGAPERDTTGADAGSVTTYTGTCYPTVTAGAGCPNSAALVPTLAFVGCPAAGLTAHLVETGGEPNGLAVIFVGIAGASLPITSACTLLVMPPFLATLAVPFDGTGGFDILTPFPNTVTAYTPAKLHLQAFHLEPATSHLVATKDLVLCL